MRLSAFAVWSAAAVLLIGPAMKAARAGSDTTVQLALSAPGLLAGAPDSAAAGSASDSLVPDLTAQFPDSAAQLSVAFGGQLLGVGAAWPHAAVAGDDVFANQTISLTNDVHIRLGAAEARPDETALPLVSDLSQLQLSRAAETGGARTLLASAEWNFSSWGGLGIAAAQGSNFAFGAPVRFDFPDTTTVLGVSAHLNFGDGWVTSFSYDEGRTQLDLRPNTLELSGDDRADARSFGVGVAKDDLFGEDALGISLIRPTQPSDSVLLASQVSLPSATPETDLQLRYETSFNGNITLQANAGYQTNVAGQNGARAISILSRAKINF